MEDTKVLNKHLVKESNTKNRGKSIVLIIILLLVFIFSLVIGKYSIAPKELLNAILYKTFAIGTPISAPMDAVIFNVRLPRIFAAIIIGAALSVSGASYQGMFKNPMVSPDILGASAGAAFGAALGILLSLSIVSIQILSFIFGLVAVGITYTLSCRIGKNSDTTLVLILAGMLIGTIFQSLVSLIKYMADPYSKLPDITYWLMGSLASINNKDLLIIIVPITISMIAVLSIRWKLNVLSFGDEEAKAMGVDTKKLRFIVIITSTLMTASAVSISGLIGWVGLIVPHFARMLVGPNYKNLLPASLIIGSTYMLLVDDLARNLYTVEIPLGILTALIGAPFFIYLMMHVKRGWV